MPTLILPKAVWTPSPNFSSRGGQRVRLIVIHDCEGSYAGSVSWFAMAASQVSANIVLREDGLLAAYVVLFANKAWHACTVNSISEGIEAAGYSAKGLGAPEWGALANLTAYRLRANGIPCQRASAANNWTGYCEHWQLGAMGGGHHDITDPVKGVATRSAFDALVSAAYALDMPSSWGPDRSIIAPAPAAPAGWKPSASTRHDLAAGSIEWVQATLNKLGIMATPMPVTGMDDAATQQAVRVFQRAHGLGVDGDAGPLTIAELAKVSAS
jgi:peptidoglycan hydrolase-like protein with peptidoglycan-binding domain